MADARNGLNKTIPGKNGLASPWPSTRSRGPLKKATSDRGAVCRKHETCSILRVSTVINYDDVFSRTGNAPETDRGGGYRGRNKFPELEV